MGRRPILLSVVLVLVAGVSGAGASQVAKPAAAGGVGLGKLGAAPAKYVPGELIVQFRKGTTGVAQRGVATASGARVIRNLGDPGLALVRVPKGMSLMAAAASLESDPSVEIAEPNYLYELTQIFPNDTRFGELWGLNNAGDHDIDAPEAWVTETGSSDVIVAVLDSGVAYDHPDLAGNIWVNNDPPGGGDQDGNGFVDDTNGWDFIGPPGPAGDNTPLDYNGHGTHVAGTIGAVGNNADGVTGVNWDVTLMPIRAADGNGSLPGSAILNGITYACANDADIVNGSFGGPNKSQTIANRIKSTACKDTLFVFAAGNEGRNLTNNTNPTNAYPCEYHRAPPHGFSVPNIICVAATRPNDALAGFSNRGKPAVHLAAPGVGILSSLPGYHTLAGFPEGFEGTVPQFQSRWGNQLGFPETWARDNVPAVGSFSLADSPNGNYVNNSSHSIRNLTAYTLTGERGCRLDYLMRLQSELGFDGLRIRAGTNTSGVTATIDEWTGSTGGQFFELSSDLSHLDNAASVYIRFQFFSDLSIVGDGVYLDEVLIKCLQANGEDYDFFDGTSMATPHVAGVAALLKAQKLAMGPAKLKNAILKGVDKKAGLADHMSTGGRLNANRSLAIVMDDTPPNTTITDRPPNRTGNDKATFKFTSSEAGSTFHCKHMNGPWRACSSPKVYKNLDNGLHTFRVRAVDRNLNVDPTPAVDTWRVT
jgi:subtilisin family serine protease